MILSKPPRKQPPWSKYIIGLWVIAFSYFLLYQAIWANPGYKAVISWDVFGYYLYLPATFLYHDLLHLHFVATLMDQYHPSSYLYAAYQLPNGNYYMSYTMGLAILFLPFFLLGHLAALLLHYPADGLSLPYQLAIYLGGAFYAFMGLLTARKVLLRFMNERTVATILLLLIFGTNYFHYSLLENGMQHVYLFFLYALVVWLTIRWHESKSWKHIIALGFTLGLMTLMRPTEIIAVLIPLLWNVTGLSSAREKAKLLFQHWKQVTAAAICFGLMALPQMIYWKFATGHFIFNSYGNLGFNFKHPHIVEGLFSIRKGWLVYTPLMVFSLLGFIPLHRHYRQQFWPVFLYFLLNIYLVYSWNIWWYGGSFGARAVVQSYAILLLPLGAWVAAIKQRRITILLFSLVCACLIFLNLFQDWQYQNNFFSTEGMPPYVYKLLFLKTHVDRKTLVLFDDPAERQILDMDTFQCKIKPIGQVFEYKQDAAKNGPTALAHNDEIVPFNIALGKDLQPGDWVEVSIKAKFDEYEWNYNNMGILSARFLTADNHVVEERHLRIQHLVGNEKISEPNDLFGIVHTWGEIKLYAQIPSGSLKADSLVVTISNPGYIPFFIDQPKLTLVEVKCP